jgi:hypothetical protein
MLQRRKPPRLLTLVLSIVAIVAMMRTFRKCARDFSERAADTFRPALDKLHDV